ncbi:MAG TPA: hypothetical protein VFU21_14090 [Kofleriaceae bacterium]|nr:hypothetical protein [Kofleriaceae bacterium]
MPSRVIAAAVLLFLAAPGAALAQAPGQTPPGGNPAAGSRYHAVPALPEVFPSPMPSLPPPARAGETGGQIGVVLNQGGFSAVLGEDGSIDFVDHHFGGGAMVLLAWLSFDATDEAMRAASEDPYLAQKLRIMDATREERMAVRRQHDAVVMRRALDDLPVYLEAVWQQTAWSPAIRRRILFALWDEAAEEGSEHLVAGGAEARATIEQFIARRIPPGHRHAFSRGELAELNRIRTSRHAFAPYPAPRVEPPAAPPLVAAALRAF